MALHHVYGEILCPGVSSYHGTIYISLNPLDTVTVIRSTRAVREKAAAYTIEAIIRIHEREYKRRSCIKPKNLSKSVKRSRCGVDRNLLHPSNSLPRSVSTDFVQKLTASSGSLCTSTLDHIYISATYSNVRLKFCIDRGMTWQTSSTTKSIWLSQRAVSFCSTIHIVIYESETIGVKSRIMSKRKQGVEAVL